MGKYKFNPITGKIDMIGLTDEQADELVPAVKEEIQVIGVSIGQYNDGDTIQAGTLHDEVFMRMLQKRIAAVYTQPTAAITNASHVVEMGASLTQTSTATFTQNDAGEAAMGQVITSRHIAEGQNIVTINVSENTNLTFEYVCQNIMNPILIHVAYAYEQGVQKKDNMGEDSGTPIAAGTVNTNQVVITPKLKIFFGSFASAPANTADIRNLVNPTNWVYEGVKTFDITTGIVNTYFVVAVPQGQSIKTVNDIVNSNADYTDDYERGKITLSINDAGGTAHNYDVYILHSDNPYPLSATHRVILK